MSRYFFDVQDDYGEAVDAEGLEMPSREKAINEARRAAADLAHEAITQGAAGPVTIKIRNQGSRVNVTVNWSVQEMRDDPLSD